MKKWHYKNVFIKGSGWRNLVDLKDLDDLMNRIFELDTGIPCKTGLGKMHDIGSLFFGLCNQPLPSRTLRAMEAATGNWAVATRNVAIVQSALSIVFCADRSQISL